MNFWAINETLAKETASTKLYFIPELKMRKPKGKYENLWADMHCSYVAIADQHQICCEMHLLRPHLILKIILWFHNVQSHESSAFSSRAFQTWLSWKTLHLQLRPFDRYVRQQRNAEVSPIQHTSPSQRKFICFRPYHHLFQKLVNQQPYNGCLVPVDDWNALAVSAYFSKKDKPLPMRSIDLNKYMWGSRKCSPQNTTMYWH